MKCLDYCWMAFQIYVFRLRKLGLNFSWISRMNFISDKVSDTIKHKTVDYISIEMKNELETISKLADDRHQFKSTEPVVVKTSNLKDDKIMKIYRTWKLRQILDTNFHPLLGITPGHDELNEGQNFKKWCSSFLFNFFLAFSFSVLHLIFVQA